MIGVDRVVRWASLPLLAAAAGLGLWRAGGETSDSPAARARSVEAQLRCPVCAEESVAASRTPTAAAMRAQVLGLVAQGRSETEVRDWFVDRYGRTILLLPTAAGPDLLVWLVPVVPGGAAAVHLVRSKRQRSKIR